MNLLRGHMELVDSRVQIVLGGQRLVLPDEVLAARPVLGGWVDDEVVVGFRPESLYLDAMGPLDLEVVLVEALGSDLLVHLATDAPSVTVVDAFDGEEVPETRVTARLSPDVHVAVGDRLRLGVDAARLHVFDLETGRALR
jgi:multiple sugar transport system ATP-binding protein